METFGSNFAAAIPAGVAWGQAAAQGADRRAFLAGGDVLAEAENFDPWGTNASAIPLEVSDTQDNPAFGKTEGNSTTGFDGNTWQSYKERYMKAISNIGDPDKYAKAMDRFANIEKSKIMGYLDAAIASAQAGNGAEASRQLAAVSAFTNPGVTPRVTYDDKSKAFMVEQPTGGYAATLENLYDLKHQMVNFEDWRKYSLDVKKFHAATASAAAARAESARRWDIENQRADETHRVRMAQAELDIAKGILDLDTATIANDQAKRADETAKRNEGIGGSANEATRLYTEMTSERRRVLGPATIETDSESGIETRKQSEEDVWVRDPEVANNPMYDWMATSLMDSVREANPKVSDKELAEIAYDVVAPHADGFKTQYGIEKDSKGNFWLSSDITSYRITADVADQLQRFGQVREQAAHLLAADPGGVIADTGTMSAIDAATPDATAAGVPTDAVAQPKPATQDDTAVGAGAIPTAPTPGGQESVTAPETRGEVTKPAAPQADYKTPTGRNLETAITHAQRTLNGLYPDRVNDNGLRAQITRAIARGDQKAAAEAIGKLSKKDKQRILGYEPTWGLE